MMSHPTQCYFCYSLRVQLCIIFSFQNQKKKEGSQELIKKPHKKHQNFCSYSQNWFYATSPPHPFFFFFICSVFWLLLILVGLVEANALKLICLCTPSSVPPYSGSVHTLRCGAVEQWTCVARVTTIILSLDRKATWGP